jgi:C4-dicarboxylate-binding protein DctP
MLRSLRLWLFAASFILAPVALAQPVVMRVSHQVPPAHHLSKLLQEFANEVKARTNGTVDVQLFGSEQLAKAGENFPQVARGNIEAAVSVNFQWGATIPEMSVTLIPYYMTDLEKIKRFTTSDARKLLDEKLEAHGVHSVGWFYITRQSIFTSGKKPIITLDDFKGLKIRGLNSLTDHALTAVGAAPSAMPGSEVYQALQAGVLDAGLTDLSAAYSRKYYDIQKYGTVAPYFTVFFHLYVNPQWWSKLTPGQRQAIDAAAAKVEQDAFTVTEATAADALVQLKAKGMQIHVQTPEEEATWRAAMQKPVLDAFQKSAPQDGRKILDLVNKL